MQPAAHILRTVLCCLQSALSYSDAVIATTILITIMIVAHSSTSARCVYGPSPVSPGRLVQSIIAGTGSKQHRSLNPLVKKTTQLHVK